MDKALEKMQKTPLEDNPPIDNDNDVDGKTLVIPTKVVERWNVHCRFGNYATKTGVKVPAHSMMR